MIVLCVGCIVFVIIVYLIVRPRIPQEVKDIINNPDNRPVISSIDISTHTKVDNIEILRREVAIEIEKRKREGRE